MIESYAEVRGMLINCGKILILSITAISKNGRLHKVLAHKFVETSYQRPLVASYRLSEA
jgi:hypothetical protein